MLSFSCDYTGCVYHDLHSLCSDVEIVWNPDGLIVSVRWIWVKDKNGACQIIHYYDPCFMKFANLRCL